MTGTEAESGRPPALQQAIDALCRRYGLAELYVFGSRAVEIAARIRGHGFSPDEALSGSDVDVGVRQLQGTRLGVSGLVDLANELEDCLGAPRVDIVLLPSASPFLALDVIRGELLYCADRDAQSEFELYVLRRAGDLAPFQRLRQELALSRYTESDGTT
jgi:uncharacterized protein